MIVVLDFGGQFAHLIARRVRELHRYSEIMPHTAPASRIAGQSPDAIILSGGPSSVLDDGAPLPDKEILSLGIPILGICYGHQAIAHLLGGEVRQGKMKEYGREQLSILNPQGMFRSCGRQETVWFSHGDTVTRVPPGFEVIASTRTCPIAAMEDPNRRIFGVQFHPEVVHTIQGMEMLRDFLAIAQAKEDWKEERLVDSLTAQARSALGDGKVLAGVSGGVDSLVMAELLRRAVGDRLFLVFIDNGLLRKDEAEDVAAFFQGRFPNFVAIDARERFLSALAGAIDPEEKRKRIGHTFIEVFESHAKVLKALGISFLAQGTIYPDRIESAEPSKAAAKIKSHHNLTLPDRMSLRIIEPLKDLYKDEVRKLGIALGLPHDRIFRHPFPGPGLAVRILGEVTEERLAMLREADHIFIDELKKIGEYSRVWQAFAAFLPVKAVGVMGDARTYEHIISLRAVTSVDGMTADWAKLPHAILERTSSRIVNEVKGVNRVVYDVTQKPPGTIEYE